MIAPVLASKAELWSAIASVGSCCAAIISLFGLRATLKESRRSADLAEKSLLHEQQPMLIPKILRDRKTPVGLLHLELRNTGRGTAFFLSVLRLLDSEKDQWLADPYCQFPLSVYEERLSLPGAGEPMPPNEAFIVEWQSPDREAKSYYGVTYGDEAGGGHGLLVSLFAINNGEVGFFAEYRARKPKREQSRSHQTKAQRLRSHLAALFRRTTKR